jgi:hypothetical protein
LLRQEGTDEQGPPDPRVLLEWGRCLCDGATQVWNDKSWGQGSEQEHLNAGRFISLSRTKCTYNKPEITRVSGTNIYLFCALALGPVPL